MRAAGLRGVMRDKTPRTTRPAPETDRPGDLVERQFTAERAEPAVGRRHDLRPDLLRLGLRRVRPRRLLPHGRRLAGRHLPLHRSRPRRAGDGDLGAAHTGADLAGLVHHSDRGVQYRAIRYTERLAEAGAVASVGSKGDSYDNAMAEAFNCLFKAELVRNKGPWTGIDDLEIAVVEYIDWFNQRRLHGELGHVPPAEYEALHAMTHPHRTPENQLTHSPSNPGLDTRICPVIRDSRQNEDNSMVTVGIDPHKHVHVAVAIDADGRRLTRPLTAPKT